MMLKLIDKAAGKWLDYRMGRMKQRYKKTSGIEFKKAEITPDGFTAEGISPAIAILADEASKMLKRAGADNYVQFDMLARVDFAVKPIRVTVQWARGESPGQQNARLRRELDELRLNNSRKEG